MGGYRQNAVDHAADRLDGARGRILADDAVKPIRATLLSALEVIAGGTSYHDVHAEFFPADERETAEWQERLARERAELGRSPA